MDHHHYRLSQPTKKRQQRTICHCNWRHFSAFFLPPPCRESAVQLKSSARGKGDRKAAALAAVGGAGEKKGFFISFRRWANATFANETVLIFSSHVIGNTIDKSTKPWLALGQERLNSIPLFSSPRSSPRQLSGQIGSDHVGGSGERALEEERSRDGTKKKRRGGRNDDDEKRPTRKKSLLAPFFPLSPLREFSPPIKDSSSGDHSCRHNGTLFRFSRGVIIDWGGMLGRSQCNAVRKNVGTVVRTSPKIYLIFVFNLKQIYKKNLSAGHYIS